MKQEQRERAAELRAAGLSYRKIGEALCLSETTIYRWLNPNASERYRISLSEYAQSLRGRCTTMLYNSRYWAEVHGYEPVNIQLEELMAFVAVANACYRCGVEDKKLHLDHCHATGAFRGFACIRCNQSFGVSERSTSSQFVGVSWHKMKAKWRAEAMIKGKRCHVGLFDDEFSAAWMRDEYVKRHVGKCYLNNLADRRQRDRRAA